MNHAAVDLLAGLRRVSWVEIKRVAPVDRPRAGHWLAADEIREDSAIRVIIQLVARQNLAVVGQSYELGRVTVFEVLAERRRYLDVERAYTEALRAAYEARTALNRALGEGR